MRVSDGGNVEHETRSRTTREAADAGAPVSSRPGCDSRSAGGGALVAGVDRAQSGRFVRSVLAGAGAEARAYRAAPCFRASAAPRQGSCSQVRRSARRRGVDPRPLSLGAIRAGNTHRPRAAPVLADWPERRPLPLCCPPVRWARSGPSSRRAPSQRATRRAWIASRECRRAASCPALEGCQAVQASARPTHRRRSPREGRVRRRTQSTT